MLLLNNLNSVFELFCTFNFAYALIDNFSKTINTRLLSLYENIKVSIDRLKSELENSHKLNFDKIAGVNLPLLAPIAGTSSKITTKDKVTSIKGKMEGYEKSILSFEVEINKKLDQTPLKKNFSFICLYSALFCISILLFGSLIMEDKCICGCNEAMFTFNVLSFAFIGYIFACELLDKLAYGVSHQRVIFIYIIISFISFSVYLVCRKFNCYMYYNGVYSLIIGFSLIIPISHFIFFFFKMFITQRRESKLLWGRINVLKTENTNLNTIIQAELQFEIRLTESITSDVVLPKSDKPNIDLF